VLDLLRLGAYQLLEMGGVPEYAAVSQTVEQAKEAGREGRWRLRERRAPVLAPGGSDVDLPGLRGGPGGAPGGLGLPSALAGAPLDAAVRRRERRAARGREQPRPELYLRALGDRAQAVAALEAAGVTVEPVPGAPAALRVTAGGLADALTAAPVIVQDPAAGLVVDFAGELAGRVVADLAAAPGGKALAMAARARFVVAADVSAGRLERARQNLDRLGGSAAVPLALVVADGRRPPLHAVDVVLVDAPCTGTGTLRRHPDGRWRIDGRDLQSLVRLQAELMDAAAEVVAPGGLLVYSTCSLEPEENEEQVQAFLARQRHFELEAGPSLPGGVVRPDGMLEVLPHVHGWDGAFAARLRRRG
jgi:16S rRNA (cytosine967-C5)-methyltransferase